MSIMERIEQLIAQGAPLTLPQILRNEINEFRGSQDYANILEAERYYRNRSDVQRKQRKSRTRSNVRLEHPLYKRLVDQKVDYLLSKPWTAESGSKAYAKALGELFDHSFRQRIKSLGKGSIKCGIAYLAPYIQEGRLQWMRLPSDQVIPEWADDEHTVLDAYIRFYERTEYVGSQKKTVEKVEFWSREGVQFFRAEEPGGTLRPDTEPESAALTLDGKPYNWQQVPLVWCKYNEEELPLSYFVRGLIDEYNWQSSVTADLLRDIAKFVWVIKGYGGEDIQAFARHVEDAAVVEVSGDGGVDKLEPSLDIASVLSYMDKTRRDLYDLAAAVDTKDPDLGNASGTAIYFRYLGLDNDCADLAAELQETFQRMKPFLDFQLQLDGKGDFSGEDFNIVFNTDLPVNEGEVIQAINNSRGLVSDRTLLAQHPYVKDVEEELKQLEKEQEQAMADFGGDLFGEQKQSVAGGAAHEQ